MSGLDQQQLSDRMTRAERRSTVCLLIAISAVTISCGRAVIPTPESAHAQAPVAEQKPEVSGNFKTGILQAERIQIVDKNNVVRMAMGWDEEAGPIVGFVDKNGKSIYSLIGVDGGVQIDIGSSDSLSKIRLFCNASGAGVRIHDAADESKAQVAMVSTKDTNGLLACDKQGQPRTMISHTNGEASVVVMGSDGKLKQALSAK